MRREPLAARIAWAVIAVVLTTGVVGALHRALDGRPDFDDLARESRFVWEHGHSSPGTAMFGYLPTTTFALWPFTAWTPRIVGIVLYVTVNLAAVLASAYVLYRWWWRGDDGPRISFAWPVLLVCANLQHALQSNQTTLWTLVLCVAGLTLVERRREYGGGVVLGLAGLVKLVPFMLVGYLVLRGRWRALAGMLVAIVLFDLAPSVAFFGWRGAVDEHLAWARRVSWHSNTRLIDEPLLRVHRHGTNASYSAVLSRWLRRPPDAQRQIILYGDPPADVIARYRAALGPDEVLTLDPMPPPVGTWAEKRVNIGWVPRFHVADLPATAVKLIWGLTLCTALAGLAWLTWRGRSAADWRPIAALWLVAMLWPSPMMRHYYLAWAFPAIVVVFRWGLGGLDVRPDRQRIGRVLAAAAVAAWAVGVACLGWRLVRWYGVHLAVLLILAAALAWLCIALPGRMRGGRSGKMQPGAVPQSD